MKIFLIEFFYFHLRLVASGVNFKKMHLNSLQSFVSQNDYDVIFNCLGLGSIEFCGDKKLVPIRGQMIRVNLWNKNA